MARKQDGTNCMIEGTYLDTPDGGIEPETLPTIYRGDNPKCSSSNLSRFWNKNRNASTGRPIQKQKIVGATIANTDHHDVS